MESLEHPTPPPPDSLLKVVDHSVPVDMLSAVLESFVSCVEAEFRCRASWKHPPTITPFL